MGIFVARPVLARAVADQALGRGLRVPEDVGILAADDDPVVAALPPTISSLRFDYAQVGRLAARLLERLMEGAPAPRRASFVPPVLIPRQSTDRQATGDPLVADALWFIDSRRTEPIRPPQVAAAFGVGVRTLQRRFRAAGRLTVEQEIIKARVEHAKLLLARPEGTVRTIARDSGFGSYGAFVRAFRRHEHMRPSQWRQQHT